MTTVWEALAVAFSHHQRGELAQATTIYRQIVEAEPEHADAWHLLGVAAHQEGRNDEAVKAISRAIAINPARAVYHNHLGAAYAGLSDLERAEASLRRALELCETDSQVHYNLAILLNLRGKSAEAVEHYRRAVELNPRSAEAHLNLGNLLRDREDWAAAEQSYRAALAARPRYVKALVNLAAVCARQRKLDEAQDAWRQIVEIEPRNFDAHFHLGSALQSKGQLEGAIRSLQAAILIDPRHAEAQNNLGCAHRAVGQLDEAERCFRLALDARPGFFEAYNNLGAVRQSQLQHDAAIDCFRKALELKPASAEALANLGSCLTLVGKTDEAIEYLRRAVAIDPNQAAAHNCLGQCLQFQGRFTLALASLDRAIALNPTEPDYHYYRSCLWLMSGDFARGWPEYEWRLKTRNAAGPYPQPRWQGEDLKGQRIVIHAEWGLGDTLHFIRYVPRVDQRGGDVFLAVQPSLIPLLEASGFRQVIPVRGKLMPDCQWQVPLMSLPGIFHTSLATIPADIPYLAARSELVEKWRERLRDLGSFKVGIHWHGSKAWATDPRSIPLAEFEPLARVGGVTLISLQKNDPTRQLQELGDRLGIVDFDDELDVAGGAFMDTAAVMKHLDLVITCDTGIAHVAGALGVPVWVVLPRTSEWRWMWDRADSPWYPTMRLFRQQTSGDWHRQFQDIAGELTRVASRCDKPTG
ncbi:MAG: tetratricopeptide repeat protein [Pirellulales bacterium]